MILYNQKTVLDLNYCPKIVDLTNFISQLLSENMANLSAVIVPAKALKDGRHKVRIGVAHNGKTRYITSKITKKIHLSKTRSLRNGYVMESAGSVGPLKSMSKKPKVVKIPTNFMPVRK